MLINVQVIVKQYSPIINCSFRYSYLQAIVLDIDVSGTISVARDPKLKAKLLIDKLQIVSTVYSPEMLQECSSLTSSVIAAMVSDTFKK